MKETAAKIAMIVLIGVADVPTLAAETPLLQPVGKWEVSFEEGLCGLRHSFGTGPDQVEVALKPPALAGRTELFLFTAPPSSGLPTDKIAMSFDDAAEVRDPYRSFLLKEPKQRVLRWETDAPVADNMAKSKIMQLRVSGRSYRLALPPSANAFKALDRCKDDLLKKWGLDLEKLHAEVRHVAVAGKDAAKWFSSNAYPVSALRVGAQGRSVALVTVSIEGKPTGCRIADSSGNADLDRQVCTIAMTRGVFVPALNASGVEAASWYVLPVRWTLPTR